MEVSKVTYVIEDEAYEAHVLAHSRDEAYSVAISYLKHLGVNDFVTAMAVSDAYVDTPAVLEGKIISVEEM